jgi:hypothetical protein
MYIYISIVAQHLRELLCGRVLARRAQPLLRRLGAVQRAAGVCQLAREERD